MLKLGTGCQNVMQNQHGHRSGLEWKYENWQIIFSDSEPPPEILETYYYFNFELSLFKVVYLNPDSAPIKITRIHSQNNLL